MTNGQRQYRKFLQSDFWKRLSKEKKDLVGKCEECGESNDLESHHLVYRDDWYKTLPEKRNLVFEDGEKDVPSDIEGFLHKISC